MNKTVICILTLALGFSSAFSDETVLIFPNDFTVDKVDEGNHDASSDDVLLGKASRPDNTTIYVYYNSAVSVSNEQMPDFIDHYANSWQRMMPGRKLEYYRVLNKSGINWGWVLFSDEQERKLLIFRSLDGSPLRYEILSDVNKSEDTFFEVALGIMGFED